MKYFIPILAFPLLNCSVAMEPAPDKMVMEQKSTFDQVKQLYNTYQSESNPQLKMKTKSQIVSLLYHFLKMGEISDTNRQEAIEIAKGIDATTLAVRLEEAPLENPFNTLPQDLIDSILELILQGGDLKQINEMLTVSKGFNKMFLTLPIHLNIFNKNISDDTLMKIVSIFPNISSLNLSWCKGITDAGLAHLQGLPNLSSLNLSNTEITDAGLAHLQGLPKLSSLELRVCKGITDAGLAHLQKLPNLSSLDLMWCEEITDAGLKYLQELPNLSSLNLTKTKITDAGLAHLQSLPNLSFLNLSFTGITDAGLDQLWAKRPNIGILR